MKKIVLFFSTLLLVIAFGNVQAQTQDYDDGYAYGYGLGKFYAKTDVMEYKTMYIGEMPSGYWQQYERRAPDYSGYEGMQNYVAERIQTLPEQYSYLRGMYEGLYWGFRDNQAKWRAVGSGGSGLPIQEPEKP